MRNATSSAFDAALAVNLRSFDKAKLLGRKPPHTVAPLHVPGKSRAYSQQTGYLH